MNREREIEELVRKWLPYSETMVMCRGSYYTHLTEMSKALADRIIAEEGKGLCECEHFAPTNDTEICRYCHKPWGKQPQQPKLPEKECAHDWHICDRASGGASINNDCICRLCGQVIRLP